LVDKGLFDVIPKTGYNGRPIQKAIHEIGKMIKMNSLAK
jgi:hypothetical protein